MSSHVISSYIHHNNQMGAIVKLTCQTDFVARTSEFQELGRMLARQVAAVGSNFVDDVMTSTLITDESVTVGEVIQNAKKTFGEDIELRSWFYLS